MQNEKKKIIDVEDLKSETESFDLNPNKDNWIEKQETKCDKGMEARIRTEDVLGEIREFEIINELELMLIELTGSKENVFKKDYEIVLNNGYWFRGKIRRLAKEWILMNVIKCNDGRYNMDELKLINIKGISTIVIL